MIAPKIIHTTHHEAIFHISSMNGLEWGWPDWGGGHLRICPIMYDILNCLDNIDIEIPILLFSLRTPPPILYLFHLQFLPIYAFLV